MAYRLKSVRYQDDVRNILLQNENGPCPLLAAANVLLLRGVIELPPHCLRSNVVKIEELVTIFADRALTKNDANQNENVTPLSAEEEEAILFRNKQSQHQVDELMQILPDLQYGMDINPKFMQGPEGYEYTKNFTAFDTMGVNLVHGWLLDPEDKTAEIIGGRTYNELIEIVVKGKDKEEEVKKMKERMKQKTEEMDKVKETKSTEENDETKSEKDWVKVSEDEGEDEGEGEGEDSDNTQRSKSNDEILNDLKTEIHEMEEQITKLQESVMRGQAINEFLEVTGHQLTRYGLEKLHEHLREADVCVFFRNNHFSTMTMFEGQLFLLVTDLGYANVDEVIWEKLDSIDGNTDYYNSFFYKPDPRDDFIDEAVLPEQMVARRKQSELDYQVALTLSDRNENEAKIPSLSNQEEEILFTDGSEERDRKLALSLQNQFQQQDASLQLARQLHEEEKRMRQQRIEAMRQKNSKSSNCIIS